ncbi:hypothetical protein DPMN_149493 [Dreissena polymorpha]|uniref:Uncharacterized protein n=1 Tax=Dreissena polymorpha TaxID=45954 RepID=A0A9D4FDM6_DREPO|nr:hypothetical protein DPMN_149493 [Dreissena polymorpha]
MSVAVTGHPIQSCSSLNLLPSASSVVSLADVSERAQFANMTRMKEEPMDVEAIDHNKEDVSTWGYITVLQSLGTLQPFITLICTLMRM